MDRHTDLRTDRVCATYVWTGFGVGEFELFVDEEEVNEVRGSSSTTFLLNDPIAVRLSVEDIESSAAFDLNRKATVQKHSQAIATKPQ